MSIKSDRQKALRKEYYSQYPSYVIDQDSCKGKSAQWVEMVTAAASKVRLNDTALSLHEADLRLAKNIRKIGYEKAISNFARVDPESAELAKISALIMPGDALFRKIDALFPDALIRYMPFSTARVYPYGQDFLVTIHELSVINTEYGHAFSHADGGITAEIAGTVKRVYISHHALIRIRDRLHPGSTWKEYGAIGDLDVCLSGRCVAECVSTNLDLRTSPASMLLALYIVSAAGRFHISDIPQEILGCIDRSSNDYFVLVGYLPVATTPARW